MILLDVSGFIQIAGLVLGGGAVTAVATALIQWVRFRKKDTSETAKVGAETEKLRMEALQIKAQAEVSISEAALKLVQRITEECEEIKQNVNKLEQQLLKMNAELIAERDKNVKLLAEIEELRKSR